VTTIAEVRDGIASAITTGCDLRAVAYLSDNIPHPVAVVEPLPFDPRTILSESKSAHQFRVRVYVGRTAERSAQIKLDELREVTGATSLTAAVQDEDNWPTAGMVDYAMVTSIGGMQIATIADEQLMVVDFEIEVMF
jgi:hypothetical protein